MSVDGNITIQSSLNDRRQVGLNPQVNIPANVNYTLVYTSGAGALQGDVLYQAPLALVAGVYNLDLNAAVQDSYGTSVVLVRVKGFIFRNNGVAAIVVGAGSTPWSSLLGATGTLTMPPGSSFGFQTPDATGWAVTSGTADVIKFTGTGTDPFEVVILGAKT